MPIKILRTSDNLNPASSSLVSADVTSGNDAINLEDPAQHIGSLSTFIKTDATANTFAINSAGLAIATLTTQGESVSVYSDGVAWRVVLNATYPYIRQVIDAFGHVMMGFTPGSPNAVNHITMSNSGAGGGPQIIAEGSDANIGIDILVKGAGQFTAGGLPIPISHGEAVPNSTAILLATLVTDFNNLLAKLRTTGIIT